MRTGLTLLFLSLLFLPLDDAHAGRRRHNDLLRVTTPQPRATTSAHPFVNVVVRFGDADNGAPADPTTFRARLGRKRLTTDLSCLDAETPTCPGPESSPMNVFLPIVERGELVGMRARLDDTIVRVGRGKNRLRLDVRSVAPESGKGRRKRKRDVDRVRFRAELAPNQPPSVTLRPVGVVVPEFPMSFGADVIDPELDDVSFRWDFGGADTCPPEINVGAPEPSVCFRATDTDIMVRLTVTDGQATTEVGRTLPVCPAIDPGRTRGKLSIEAEERLEYGSIPVGATATRVLTVRNTDRSATSQLRVGVAIDGAGFALDTNDVVIGPGEAAPLTLSFTPDGEGHRSARIIVVSCATNAPAVQLLAHGVGGELPGTTFARDMLFFTDAVPGILGIGTFGLPPNGEQVFIDSTVSLCQAPANGPGTGDSCLRDRDCINGGTCLKSAICLRGERAGEPCTQFSDCPGGFCPAQSDFDPLDMCSDGNGSLYLMSDEGTFTDLSSTGTELSGTLMRVDFDPTTGARLDAEILGRTTTQTLWMACDRMTPQNRGSVYLAEYQEVFLPGNCFRDEQERLVSVRKRNGARSVLIPRIDSVAGQANCQGDYEISEDLQVSTDGSVAYATIDTGLYRLLPSPLLITPDYIELFQLHSDGAVVLATTNDQGLTGSLELYKIFPEQAALGAVRLDEATPCGTLSLLNNGGRTAVNYPFAVGAAASPAGGDVILVSFVATGGVARTGPSVLSSNLRLQGTAAFHSPANSPACTFLGYVNLDLMELLTF